MCICVCLCVTVCRTSSRPLSSLHQVLVIRCLLASSVCVVYVNVYMCLSHCVYDQLTPSVSSASGPCNKMHAGRLALNPTHTLAYLSFALASIQFSKLLHHALFHVPHQRACVRGGKVNYIDDNSLGLEFSRVFLSCLPVKMFSHIALAAFV